MKFQKWLDEQTTTGDIALNLAKGGKHGGGVDVIGADCPDGQKWDKKKGKCVGSRLKESLVGEATFLDYDKSSRKQMKKAFGKKDVPKEFMNDPLYKKVLTAKNKKDFDKALETLQKIRGSSAVASLKKAIKKKKFSESLDEAARPLFKIAMDIGRDWKKVNYAAKPYLDAMSQLEFINDMYFMDSAREVVARFLANAGTWKGPVAKKIKAELKSMLKR